MNQHLLERIQHEEEVRRVLEERLAALRFLVETGLLVSLGQNDIETAFENLEAQLVVQETLIDDFKWLLNQ